MHAFAKQLVEQAIAHLLKQGRYQKVHEIVIEAQRMGVRKYNETA